MIRSLLLTAPLLAVGAALQTGGGPQETPVPPGSRSQPPVQDYRAQKTEELLAGLTGTWQMTQFIHATALVDSNSVRGFAMFHEGYGSILFQAIDSVNDFEPEPLYQSTVFHYRIDERLRLQTSTLAGHSNFSGEFSFEDDWTPREFNVDMLGNRLVLTRPDGARLQFERMVNDRFPTRTLNILRDVRAETPSLDPRDNAGPRRE